MLGLSHTTKRTVLRAGQHNDSYKPVAGQLQQRPGQLIDHGLRESVPFARAIEQQCRDARLLPHGDGDAPWHGGCNDWRHGMGWDGMR